jgi:hypothetical protein
MEGDDGGVDDDFDDCDAKPDAHIILYSLERRLSLEKCQ